MSEEVKKYRVLKPVAISGIVQRGAIVELTEAEAENIGIGEYLEEVVDEAASEGVSEGTESETDQSKDGEESDKSTDTETQTDKSGSVEKGSEESPSE